MGFAVLAIRFPLVAFLVVFYTLITLAACAAIASYLLIWGLIETALLAPVSIITIVRGAMDGRTALRNALSEDAWIKNYPNFVRLAPAHFKATLTWAHSRQMVNWQFATDPEFKYPEYESF